ncbi:Eco57I restriction-modification methylase domain-containing protein [Actinomadura geliboluensis]|uniref:Eco57I restriction-modification methylase domain-containing protein n=1 Tax=Actinomadura geliboluensis TaxID=882440 RepID=UPI0037197931
MARFARRQDDFDHTGWLDLIDVTGPFLSLPVLRRTWPALDALGKEARERLRLKHKALPGRPWIDYVLTELLGWGELVQYEDDVADLTMDVPTHDTTVAPSFALREPGADAGADAKSIRVLGLICDAHPNQRIKESDWPATPADRLAQLCRHHDVPLGIATDGRWWALIWAPRGGVTTTAVFDAVTWQEAAERDVVRAFVSILCRTRFFGVPDGETLPDLLEASKDSQEEITEALGVQVRQAVELLVAAIGRSHTSDIARGGTGIGDVPAREVYRGAVAVMMRIIFLLCAEECGLLPADRPLYRKSYSAGLLCSELEERVRDGSEEDLEHTYAGWSRLLALFAAVYQGIDHPDMPIPPHDGSIFDADRYPWLPETIDDRTVLHILQSVQYVQIGTGKMRERRRLSFRTLAVEEIGYVYEGLLSHDAYYAGETHVGLIGRPGHEEEVALSALEDLAGACPDVPSLAARLADEYKDSRIGSPKAVERRLAPLTQAEKKEAERKLLAVTWGDYELTERLLPFFGLIRRDLRDLPMVILTDALYVTESPLRQRTGAHYTPSELATKVVENALEPLVYSPGPVQTADRKEWSPRSSGEILSLRIVDIAMGSGAFLVAACRYLANHLVGAWISEGDERVRDYKTAATVPSFDADADSVVVEARRQIIEHCLYGADINDMAVDIAKLSLWLVCPDRPFAFLDDRLIIGDSLLGITSLDQLEVMHMDVERGRALHEDDGALFDLTSKIRVLVRRVAIERRRLVEIEGTDLNKLDDKRLILDGVARDTEWAQLLADLTTGSALVHAGRGKTGLDTASKLAVAAAREAMAGDESAILAARRRCRLWLRADLPDGAMERRPLHWPLVFPEVFETGGFDAVIGNPPFRGGSKISGLLGGAYRDALVQVVAGGARGNADLVAYFLIRAHEILGSDGQSGLIATNTLAQGGTREVGLDRICATGTCIRRAIKSEPWPSKRVSLEYCVVWTSKAPLGKAAECVVDEHVVPGITPALDPITRVNGAAERLVRNSGLAFEGTKVTGSGFIVSTGWARRLLCDDPEYEEVLYPYLNGEDVVSRPDSSASRYVINFHDWRREKVESYRECYEMIRRHVLPVRVRSSNKVIRENWWLFERPRDALYRAVASLERVIVLAKVSKVVMPVLVPCRQVFSHMLGVFASDDTAMLALLSSAPHYWWTLSRASTLETRVRYTPSDVFETLPLPEMTTEMRVLGDRLDRFRRDLMLARQTGLTKTYNMVHDPTCMDADIVELRQIHEMIDEAVCRAYGWHDLVPQLGHGHHDAGRDTRYTVPQVVQREIVDRLLELNHERYAAEVAAGLHDKKAKGAPKVAPGRGATGGSDQQTLLDVDSLAPDRRDSVR